MLSDGTATVRKRHQKNDSVSQSSPCQPPVSPAGHAKTTAAAVATGKVSAGSVVYRFLRRCGWLLVYIFIAIVTPMILNHAALVKEQKALMPTPGSLVRVKPHQRLFLRCLGRGTPVVVLEAPMGETHGVYEKLQVLLAKHTRVCSYDRAGLGFSERPYVNHSAPVKDAKVRGMPHTVEFMVEDLYKLLVVESELPPPYVFVATEMGTLVTRFFAQIFEGSVAGVVLVDPLVEGVENMEDAAVRHFWKESRLFPWQQQQLMAATGWYRIALLSGMASKTRFDEGSSELHVARQKHLLCNPAHWQSAVEELFLVNETMAQIQLLWRIKSFPGNISVSVVTGDVHDTSASDVVNKAWQLSQKHLVEKLHPGCKHRQLPGAVGSRILKDRSSQLHEAVLGVLDDVRSQQASKATEQDAVKDTLESPPGTAPPSLKPPAHVPPMQL